jgi:hypothetical protein
MPSPETLTLRAGEEAPRCQRCDAMLTEHAKGDPLDCGCVPAYEIVRAPTSANERIICVNDTPEAGRATVLAISFGGRYVRAYKGFALMAAKVAQFERFFSCGAIATRSYRNGPNWRYRFPNSRESCNIYSAQQYVREVCK